MGKMAELAYEKDKHGDKEYIKYLEDKLETLMEAIKNEKSKL